MFLNLRKVLCGLVLALMLAGQSQAASVFEGRTCWALLMGVENYERISDLTYCGDDMLALGEELVAAGFDRDHVVVLHDEASAKPTKRNFERELRAMLANVQPGDAVLVGFSGHGVELRGNSYWCPSEAGSNVNTLISIADVVAALDATGASLKLVVGDACRNDPYAASSVSHRRDGREMSGQRLNGGRATGHPAASNDNSDTIVLLSCESGETSLEVSKLRHALFMHYVLAGLKGDADANHNGTVTLMELYAFAKDMTVTFANRECDHAQTPTIAGQPMNDIDLFDIGGTDTAGNDNGFAFDRGEHHNRLQPAGGLEDDGKVRVDFCR